MAANSTSKNAGIVLVFAGLIIGIITVVTWNPALMAISFALFMLAKLISEYDLFG